MRAPPSFTSPPPAPLDLATAVEADLVARAVRRRRRTLMAGVGISLAVPLTGQALLARQVSALEDQLTRQAGVPCAIASVEAGLTGTLRIGEVRLGDMLNAEALEASMSWTSLLSGAGGARWADEVRVVAPRLAISVDEAGESDLGRALGRLAAARRPRQGERPPADDARRIRRSPRRIVVSEGELALTIAGVASLRASGVELVPQEGGVRATAGHIEITATLPGAALGLQLGRAAADLRLPQMTVERMIAVGGRGTLRLGQVDAALSGLSLARLGPAAPLTAQLTLDDRGVPRPLEVQLTAHPFPAVQVKSARLPLWPLADLLPGWVDAADASFSGQLAISRGDGLGLSIDGRLERARVNHPVIASAPVELTVDVAAAAQLSSPSALAELVARPAPAPASILEAVPASSPAAQAALDAPAGVMSAPESPGRAAAPAPLDLSVTGRFVMGRASGEGQLLVHRGAALAATFELSIERAPCSELYAAVPRGLRAPLDGLALAGELGGRMRVSVDTSAPLGEGAEVALEPEGSCRVLAEPALADVTTLMGPREHTFPDGSRAAIGPGVGSWLELRQLPAHVDGAFVAAEDARFFDHPGFDLAQIGRSLEIDLREGRLARGGSTISQQLIKNAFLDGKRSLARKLSEAVLTWRLEARLGKRDILERYLNIIELGPSIYGLPAAAQHWFGVAPAQLTVRQAAFLAALTPEPTTMTRRILAAGGLDRASATRVETVLRAMKRQGLFDQAALELARRADLGLRAAALRAPAAKSSSTTR
jgi:Transglycosylase